MSLSLYTPTETAPSTPYTGGYVSPKSIWALGIREKSLLLLGIKPQFLGYQAYSLVVIPAELFYTHKCVWRPASACRGVTVLFYASDSLVSCYMLNGELCALANVYGHKVFSCCDSS
jgi:hypothetical protein